MAPKIHSFSKPETSKRLSKSCLIVLALSILQPLIACQADDRIFIAMTDEVRTMCEQAEQLINSRKFNEAEQLLHRAEQTDPNCAEVHGYLGMAYQNQLKTQKAVEEYSKALQLNPQMSFIKVNLGTCYMNLNQLDQAVPYFQQYLQENPNAPDAAQIQGYIQQAGTRQNQQGLRGTVESGQAFLNQHKYGEACAAFEQAIAQQPNFAPAHFYLAYALAQSGQNQRAIAEFQTCLQIDPSMKEAVLNIGSNYQSIGDCANAISWYERYLQENPHSSKAGEIQQRIRGLRQQISKSGQSAPTGAALAGSGGMQNPYAAPAGSGGMQNPYAAPAGSGGMQNPYTAAAGSGGMQNPYAAPASGGMQNPYAAPASGGMQNSYAAPAGSGGMQNPYTAPAGSGGMQNPYTAPAGSGGMQNPYTAPAGSSGMQNPNVSPVGMDDNYFASACTGGHCYRWGRMPVRVFIANGSGTPGYRESYFAALADSFSKWAQATENRLAFIQVQNPAQAQIVCAWTGDANKIMDRGQAIEGGLTKLSGQPQADGTVLIGSARLTILTNRSGEPLSDDDMKKVCLHEVGHAIGINGHSNNNSDIMFFSESPTVWPALTKRDKATACQLYAGYPRTN